MRRIAALLALTMVAVPAALPSAPVRPARAGAVDWTRRTAATPEGGILRGNPAAKVKVVEFASFTCSHCAHFQAEAKAPMDALIRSGRVSLEVRIAVRDRFDFTAALLARCQGPAGFFRAADAIFADQPRWLEKAMTFTDPPGVDQPNDALAAVARGVGLDRLAGVPPARVAACVADPAQQERLAQTRNEAFNVRQFEGTPAFLVNGVAVGSTWQKLEPAIRAALG